MFIFTVVGELVVEVYVGVEAGAVVTVALSLLLSPKEV